MLATVAHVVAHVVGDNRRVARVILGDARFELSYQVGADVSGLGVDAAAQTPEDADETAAKTKPDQIPDMVRVARINRIKTGDSQQSQPDDKQSGYRATAERNIHCRTKALPGSPAVRTLARTETNIPIQPVEAERTAPTRKAIAVPQLIARARTANRTTATMATY